MIPTTIVTPTALITIGAVIVPAIAPPTNIPVAETAEVAIPPQYIIFKYDLIFSSPNISIKNSNPCFFFINSHSSIFILSISFILSVSAFNNALKNSSNFSFKSSLLI